MYLRSLQLVRPSVTMQLFTIHAPCSYSEDIVVAKLVAFTGPQQGFTLLSKTLKEKKTCH